MVAESELLNHLRGQREAQFKGAMAMLRWLTTCVDEPMATRMRQELKRDILIPLETRFRAKTLVKTEATVVESAIAEHGSVLKTE